MSSLEEVIKELGAAVVAGRMGVSLQRLGNWIERGVPTDQCASLERATDGRWTRQQMRPDSWHLIWPELTGVTVEVQAGEGA